MFTSIVVAIAMMSSLSSNELAHHHNHHHHIHPVHKPLIRTENSIDSFAQCVSNRESSGDFHINTGNGYYGGYQFDIQTWLEAQKTMGVYFSSRADLATESQQTAVFHFWETRNPGAWPLTVPACGGAHSYK